MTQILSELFSGVLYLFTAAGLKTCCCPLVSAAFWRICRRYWAQPFPPRWGKRAF